MNNEKMDAILNLSLDSTSEERARSNVLEVGFDRDDDTWEVVVKFNGNFRDMLDKFPVIEGLELLYQYAILRVPEDLVDAVANDVQISYMEKPKNLFFAYEKTEKKNTVIVNRIEREDVGTTEASLAGRGTIIAIVDSGIDYAHPDFCNADGTTRILFLWDQTLQRVYDSQQINEALAALDDSQRYALVPSRDLSGHGTHVAGIAAGNGRASGGRYIGVAPEASLIVVKLGAQRAEAFPKTTELMSAVDFCLRQAYVLKMPVVVNLSFGNNYGGHDGTSLLETYLNDVSDYWKSLIVTGTGNEGVASIHTKVQMQEVTLSESDNLQRIRGRTQGDNQSQVGEQGLAGNRLQVDVFVGDYNTGFNIQIWKNYPDEMRFSLIGPDGRLAGILRSELGTQRFQTVNTEILVYYGLPTPFSVSQEIFLDFIPQESYVAPGIWKLEIEAIKIVEGTVSLWLPGQAVVGESTAFLLPVEETTLTIPSTASKILSVGAYDNRFLTMAAFSGRGYTRNNQFIKPDVVAPGVDIMSTSPGGGYTMRSGTSMAAPYVSGQAALLMEAGIVNGTDPFMFGSKIIATMQRSAQPLPGYEAYPNPVTGWGRIG